MKLLMLKNKTVPRKHVYETNHKKLIRHLNQLVVSEPKKVKYPMPKIDEVVEVKQPDGGTVRTIKRKKKYIQI